MGTRRAHPHPHPTHRKGLTPNGIISSPTLTHEELARDEWHHARDDDRRIDDWVDLIAEFQLLQDFEQDLPASAL